MAGLRNVKVFPDALLPVFQTQLVAVTLINTAYVYLLLTEDQPDVQGADHYLSVVLGRQTPDASEVAGMGSVVGTPTTGELTTVLWTRLYVDQAGRGDAYLTNATLGALGIQRLILKALEQFDPTNGSGDYYLMEPMRVAGGGWSPRPLKSLPNWGGTGCAWEFKYLADVLS